jgi:hypothetical protein
MANKRRVMNKPCINDEHHGVVWCAGTIVRMIACDYEITSAYEFECTIVCVCGPSRTLADHVYTLHMYA